MDKCDKCNEEIKQMWSFKDPNGLEARFCSVLCLFHFLSDTFGNMMAVMAIKRGKKAKHAQIATIVPPTSFHGED